MAKTIKTTKGAHGNKLEFYTVDHLGDDALVVRDWDAQMERIYRIGQVQELNDFERVEIVSFDQVVEAWESGSVWF